VEVEVNQSVLDYCAGSGGKTLGFIHKLKGTGQIYLHDIRNTALEKAKKRLDKAGFMNY
jgi:16S rRNA C967 or C1407 C5-methylase (RsmB/RsmF family)